MVAGVGGYAVVVAADGGAAPPERFNPLRAYLMNDPLAAIIEPDELRRAIGSDAYDLNGLRLGVKQ